MASTTEILKTPDELGALLTRLIANSPDFASRLQAQDAEGRHPIVAALDSEPLVDVIERVRRCGGEGSVMTLRPGSDGKLLLVVAKMTVAEQLAEDGDHHVPFDASCTLGDLLKVLGEGASITLRLTDGDDLIELEDVGAPEVELKDEQLALT